MTQALNRPDPASCPHCNAHGTLSNTKQIAFDKGSGETFEVWKCGQCQKNAHVSYNAKSSDGRRLPRTSKGQ